MTHLEIPARDVLGPEEPVVDATKPTPGGTPVTATDVAAVVRRLRRSRVGVITLVAGLAIVISLFLLMGRGSGPVDVTNDLVDGLVSRDAKAAVFLADPDALLGVARQFGLDLLPRSVAVALGERHLREVEGSTGEASQVIGTWTLTTSGRDGHGERVEQKATFDLSKAANGSWLVDRVTVSMPVEFDLAAYFGDDGTRKADRDAALEDLRAGVAWLGGVKVEATESTTEVTADPMVSDDPDAFISQGVTTKEAVVGKVTHWAIRLGDGDGSQDLEVATGQTVQAEPAQVMRGTLTEEGVLSDAGTWARAWVQAVLAGDNDAILQVTKTGVVSPSGWERMKVGGELLVDANAAPELVTDTPITVRYGGLELVRQNGGTWLVDPQQSDLIRDWLPGSGKVITVKNSAALIDFSNCLDTTGGATSRLSLDGVAFYGAETAPVAVFRFTASGDMDCADGIPVDELRITWKGHSDAAYLYPAAWSEEAKTSFVRVALPGEIGPDQAPVRIHVTVSNRYGRTGGASDFTVAP